MDFKWLATFAKVAEMGSLSRAADRLRVAQPALSRQIQLLEQDIGAPLFDRHRRGMILTKAGEELRDRIAGPLRQLEQVYEDVRALSHAVGGQIAFGMPPTVSYVLAGPLARSVVRHAPNVSLRVVEGYGAHLIDWLHRGEIDVALLYGPTSSFNLDAHELLVEEIMLVGPPESDLHVDRTVLFADLAKLPMVLPSRPHGLRILADEASTKAGMALDIRFQADSFLLMKELVESGLGYTLLPHSAFSREVEAGRLRHAPIREPKVTRQLILATPRGHNASRASRILDGLVRREITSLVKLGRWAAQLMFELEDSNVL